MNPWIGVGVLEGVLTIEFGDRIKARKRESMKTRITLRLSTA